MNGGGLLGSPIAAEEWAPVREPRGLWDRMATLGLGGSAAFLALAGLKLAYYWPVLQSGLATQFTCLH